MAEQTYSVCEDRRIVTVQDILQQRLRSSSIHIRLASVTPEYAIENKPPVFVPFRPRRQKSSFYKSSRCVPLLWIECENTVVDNLDDVAQRRLA